MKLIYEHAGESARMLEPLDVPALRPADGMARKTELKLPRVAESEMSRHYAKLGRAAFGVCDGFYPLGSCTMKYNPKVNEAMAALPGFTDAHPTQDAPGCAHALALAKECLTEITGMDDMTFEPCAGAHGEFTSMLMVRAYHLSRGDHGRTKIIVPDSAHGTNPASAAMAGFEVVPVASTADGRVDVEALRALVGDDTAALMLTNPNTLGLFDENILEITRIVREAGGVNYYDGANLNAVMGVARPGDMGFDLVHLNLHKTFSTPHGGGGPGSGAVGCKAFLAPFLPGSGDERSIGRVQAFGGNFLVVVKALCYLLALGREGVPAAAKAAVLNANYLKKRLSEKYACAAPGVCMHEFVLDLTRLRQETGVSAMDVAKGAIDCGMHPPTMYFPLIVHEALMFEPTETETRETLDQAADAYLKLFDLAYTDPEALHNAPATGSISRPDEVAAARSPRLRYEHTA